MTLRCECGGAVELQAQSYNDTTAHETYECASCGRTGSLSFGDYGETKTGCLA